MGNGTDIGKVRGLGSAKHGSQHWIAQRMTAIGNILLSIWFVASLALLPNFEYETLVAWVSQTSVALPMVLLIICLFWHIRLGLQVFVEDYVHDAGFKLAALIALNFYVFGGVAFGIFTIAKLAFTGAPA
jgi:succinate dehydrogenase / fumarate reductase, membrane anchor subunit